MGRGGFRSHLFTALDETVVRKNNEDMPVENLHFSFAFYGGAMLSHFVPSLGRGFIDMFKVNRNSIVVMDRDLDFIRGKNGEEVCVKKGCAKEAVLTRFLKDFSLGQFCWLTEGYTVEGYLLAVLEEDILATRQGVFSLLAIFQR